MNLFSLKNVFGRARLLLLLTFVILLLSVFLFMKNKTASLIPNSERTDILAYVSDEDDLVLYNPRTRSKTTVLNGVKSFMLSQDGQIAFIRQEDTDPDIYLMNPQNPELAPLNISQNANLVHQLLAWSPDGHYLAFTSYQDSNKQVLYVWDGESVTSLMPENDPDSARGFSVHWSQDGRLAFRVQYEVGSHSAEIYIWDGQRIVNLSQNPESWDGGAVWSTTGQLMFSSYRHEGNGIYIWDGQSFKDGLPDTDSFTYLDFEQEISGTTWTEDGLIGFTAKDYFLGRQELSRNVIYLWNPKTETIVRRIPVLSRNAWSGLSGDGKTILSSHLASGLPSYYLDVENTEGDILFSTHTGEFAWSVDAYLAYCHHSEDRDWILSLWDGAESWEVTESNYKPVRWQSGGGGTFSCNSG